MKFKITNPYVVAIQLKEMYDHPARTEWFASRTEWIASNIKNPYESFFIRNAVEVTPAMIETKNTKGDWFGELWVFHFQNPCDASHFKLRWA